MNFLWYLLIICCAFQVAYQLILISVIISHKKKFNRETYTSTQEKSVSVIICAKNETANLHKNLPYILNQKFKNFEVIVVDDGSDEPLTINNERLTIITLTKNEKIGLGKKYALQKGIELASKEIILLTDADCQPVSENWITEMTSLINEKHKIVLGISPYKYESTFLNAIIEYETAQTAFQYLGFAILGIPYMCVGRNVCYDAKLLKSKTWNKSELAIASGDDDLTLQSLATQYNTTVCFSEESYTVSEAKNSWKSWLNQKTRHAESGFLYKLPYKMALGTYIFTKNVNYLCFFYILCMLNKFNFVVLLLVIVTMMITCIVNMLLHITLNLQKRWNYTLILDPIYGTIPLFTGFQNLFQSNRKWK